MADNRSLFTDRGEGFDMGALWRVAMWGGTAALALGVAILSGYSETGVRRLAAAQVRPDDVAKPLPPPVVVKSAPRGDINDAEVRRLNDAVRSLTAERERLTTRVTALERRLDDVTGTVNRVATERPRVDASADAAPVEPPPPPAMLTTAAGVPARSEASLPAVLGTDTEPLHTASVLPAADAVPSSKEPSPTEFGVDIGGAKSMSGLATIWTAARARNAALLGDLRPIAAVREAPNTGGVELRLIVGPLANAEVATQLCGSLAAQGTACRPAPFDGQRLALR